MNKKAAADREGLQQLLSKEFSEHRRAEIRCRNHRIQLVVDHPGRLFQPVLNDGGFRWNHHPFIEGVALDGRIVAERPRAELECRFDPADEKIVFIDVDFDRVVSVPAQAMEGEGLLLDLFRERKLLEARVSELSGLEVPESTFS